MADGGEDRSLTQEGTPLKANNQEAVPERPKERLAAALLCAPSVLLRRGTRWHAITQCGTAPTENSNKFSNMAGNSSSCLIVFHVA